MNKINKLSADVYNRISAGEIIEDSIAIIRELLDNSIDANSNNIEIKIVDSSKSSITIKDNGCGMTYNDIKLCFLKHTTSKIKDFKDLYNIDTMGFRGEGLNTITTISNVCITSKSSNSEFGYKVNIKNNKLISEEPYVMNPGTSISVNEIFNNIPVRKNTLNQTVNITRKIKDFIINKIIPFIKVSITVYNDNKPILTIPKTNTLKNRLYSIYGDLLEQNIIEINNYNEKNNIFKVQAFISKYNCFKSNKNYQKLYIKNRFVKNNLFNIAISNAYRNIVPIGKHPIVIMFIDCPSSSIDINIHPAKREIKFLNEKLAYRSMYYTIKLGLESINTINTTNFSEVEHNFTSKKLYTSYNNKNNINKNSTKSTNINCLSNISYKNNNKNKDISSNHKHLLNNSSISNINTYLSHNSTELNLHFSELESAKLLGTVFGTYILLYDKDNIIIIDQHALHEKIIYNKLIKRIQEKIKIQSELLLKSIIIDKKDIEYISNKNIVSCLSKLGFIIEYKYIDSFIIKAIPYWLKIQDISLTLNNIISSLNFDETKDIEANSIVVLDNILKNKACKLAIKSNDLLTEYDIKLLVSDYGKNKNNIISCPHGRPTIKIINKEFFKNLFER